LELTDNVSHAGTPTFLEDASLLRPSYTERIRGDAGSVFGRANGAPMRAFSAGESLDIFDLPNSHKRCTLFLIYLQDAVKTSSRSKSYETEDKLSRSCGVSLVGTGHKTRPERMPRAGFSADSAARFQWVDALFRDFTLFLRGTSHNQESYIKLVHPQIFPSMFPLISRTSSQSCCPLSLLHYPPSLSKSGRKHARYG